MKSNSITLIPTKGIELLLFSWRFFFELIHIRPCMLQSDYSCVFDVTMKWNWIWIRIENDRLKSNSDMSNLKLNLVLHLSSVSCNLIIIIRFYQSFDPDFVFDFEFEFPCRTWIEFLCFDIDLDFVFEFASELEFWIGIWFWHRFFSPFLFWFTLREVEWEFELKFDLNIEFK